MSETPKSPETVEELPAMAPVVAVSGDDTQLVPALISHRTTYNARMCPCGGGWIRARQPCLRCVSTRGAPPPVSPLYADMLSGGSDRGGDREGARRDGGFSPLSPPLSPFVACPHLDPAWAGCAERGCQDHTPQDRGPSATLAWDHHLAGQGHDESPPKHRKPETLTPSLPLEGRVFQSSRSQPRRRFPRTRRGRGSPWQRPVGAPARRHCRCPLAAGALAGSVPLLYIAVLAGTAAARACAAALQLPPHSPG